jgi:cell division protein FtsB
MQQQLKKIVYVFYIAVATVLSVAILGVNGKDWLVKTRQTNSLKNKRDELSNSLKVKKEDIAKVKENIERFNTDRDFVEELARKSRRVSRSDIVFVFGEDSRR